MRSIWLCADDYGMSRAVSRGIRELLALGRINATSAMVVANAFTPDEAEALLFTEIQGRQPAIGLHVTLTAPFRPLTANFPHVADGKFCALADFMRRAVGRRLETAALAAEIAAQLAAFTKAFGRPPDFVDGHQHVQLFPQVRDAFLRTVVEQAPNAWVRQCGGNGLAPHRVRGRKALVLEILSFAFRRKARRYGLRFNPAFAGSYDFVPDADFSRLFPRFLDGLPDGGLVMCHPGFVDAELVKLDPLTTLREREYAYFKGEQFLQTLAEKDVALA